SSLVMRNGAVLESSTIHVDNARHGPEIPHRLVFFSGSVHPWAPALAARPSGHVDALQYEQQFCSFDYHVSLVAVPRQLVAAMFEPLHRQNVAVAIPIQNAHAIGTLGE